MWKGLYRFYTDSVFPWIKPLRGATRFKRWLKFNMALEELEEGTAANGRTYYEYHLRGEKIRSYDHRDFAEMVDVDPVGGYLKYYEPGPGDVVVDAGAYPGVFTVYVAGLVGDEGIVLALEPHPDNFRALQETLELNGVENVELLQCGLWEGDTTSSVSGSGGRASLWGDGGEVEVELRSLDSLVDELGVQVDFLKMDVEGAEIEALKGAGEILSGSHPHVAVASYHVRDGEETCGAVEEILEDYGFSTGTGHEQHLTTYGVPSGPGAAEV